MKKYLLVILSLLFAKTASAQVVVQTWIDPCTNIAQTATFPLSSIGVTIVYRGQSKTFTAQQAAAGELQLWINQVTILTPCPITNNPVVQQAATQAAQQTAQQSASSAAATTATGASNSSSSSSETKSEARTESSSESKSAENSESKKDEKKEDKKDNKKKSEEHTNPIMIVSDLTTGQNPGGGISQIITVGVSQSSLVGDKSYGITGMLWSTFNQGALSLTYTKMNFKIGKLQSISSYGSTSAYLKSTLMQMTGYTWVKPDSRFGIYGVSVGVIGLFIPNGITKVLTDSAEISNLFLEKYNKTLPYRPDSVSITTHGYNVNWATSAVAFWMRPPIKLNPRWTVSPQVFLMSSPVSYGPIVGFTTSTGVGMMLGDSWDYKLTKRFGMSFAHRIMMPQTGKSLNFLLIGSRMIL